MRQSRVWLRKLEKGVECCGQNTGRRDECRRRPAVPPRTLPELTNQARQVGSSYGKGNRGAKFHPFLKMFRSELILRGCAMCKIVFRAGIV
jgi:hypothetical protein